MLCEKCHKEPATVFLTQVVNGKKIELHLCSRCAKEQENILYGDDTSLQQFISGLMNYAGQEPDTVDVKKQAMTMCPKCHMTLKEFQKTSKLGCEKCYEVFSPNVRNIIKSVHGGVNHTGKKPARMNQKQLLTERIETLKSDLKLAILQEDYMKAAEIRDQLKQIRGSEKS